MRENLNRNIGKRIVYLRILAFVLVTVLAIGTIPVSAASKKKVTVTNKTKLLAELKQSGSKTIIFSSKTKKTITIPTINGTEKKTLVIDAKNAKIVNKSAFKGITLKNCSTFTEKAKGNKINITGNKVKLIVSKSAKLAKLTLSGKSADVTAQKMSVISDIECNKKSGKYNIDVADKAIVSTNVIKKATLNITGSKKADVDVEISAKGSIITAETLISVNTKADATLNLKKGSEGSEIVSTSKVNTKINNTSTKAPTVKVDGNVVSDGTSDKNGNTEKTDNTDKTNIPNSTDGTGNSTNIGSNTNTNNSNNGNSGSTGNAGTTNTGTGNTGTTNTGTSNTSTTNTGTGNTVTGSTVSADISGNGAGTSTGTGTNGGNNTGNPSVNNGETENPLPVPTPSPNNESGNGAGNNVGNIPSDTNTPTPTEKVTNTPAPTEKVTNTPTPTEKATNIPTPTETVTNTPAPTETVTNTPTPTETVTNTPTPTETVTNTPTPTEVVTNTPTPTEIVTSTPTPTEIVTSTPTPTESIGRPYTTKILVDFNKSEARTMLSKINELRAAENDEDVEPLVIDYDLEKVAMQRAAELAVSFGNTRPDGKSSEQTLVEYGFDPDDALFAEMFCMGDKNTVDLDAAFDYFASTSKYRISLTGYYSTVGIGHVKIDETDFWVINLSTAVQNIDNDNSIDGKVYFPLNIPETKLASVTLEYASGAKTVKVGESVSAPVYLTKARFSGSEMDAIYLESVDFWSEDEFVKASNSTITGKKAGTGTISGTVLGKTVSVEVLVTE